jgi:hypothetical protein
MIILSLDLSTSSSGWSLFDSDDNSILEYGIIKPKVKGITKLKYPKKQLLKIMNSSEQLVELIDELDPDQLVIEEVNRGINRIAQKSLDALHFIFLAYLSTNHAHLIDNLVYMDSNGAVGWRTKLGLTTKAYKGTSKNRTQKWKKAAEDFIRNTYGLEFDVWKIPGDADICDSIAMGIAYLMDMEAKDADSSE